MNDCYRCPYEKDCCNPFKVLDCDKHEKFWSKEHRHEYDAIQAAKHNAMRPLSREEYNKITNS